MLMSLVESLQPHLPSPCCVSIRWRGAARLGVATPGSERRGIREDRKGAEAVQGEAWYGGRDGQRRGGQGRQGEDGAMDDKRKRSLARRSSGSTYGTGTAKQGKFG